MTVETSPVISDLSLTSIVVVDTAAIATDLDGEVIILDTAKGIYYGLDAVGASIWNLIQQPKTLAEVRSAITEEYEVDPDTCERDLIRLIQSLSSNGLVNVSN